MRWADERYVRVYTRDTGEWLALGWEAQALFLFALRKADRAGIVQTGKARERGLAGMTGMPLEVVQRALPLLLEDGCMREAPGGYVIPNFIAAQETPISTAQRKRDERERDRDKAMASGISGSKTGLSIQASLSRQEVTPGSHARKSRENVTPSGHAITSRQRVTPNLTVPNRAEDPPYPPSGEEMAQRPLLDFEQRTQHGPEEEPPAGPAPEELQALWNRLAPTGNRRPLWKNMDAERRRAAKTALEVCPDLVRWEAFLKWHLQLPFYRGEEGWKGANVAWLLRKERAREVCDFDPERPPPLPTPGRGRGMTDTRPSDFSELPEGGEDLGTMEVT